MRRLLVAAASTVLMVCLAPAMPAHADDTPPAPEQLTFTPTAVLDEYGADGTTVVSSTAYPASTEDVTLGELKAPVKTTNGSGSGGNSSASGCRRVTVNNVAKTLLGYTAFVYHTWTRWCWNRATQTVSSVTHGWTISDVDSQHQWQGIVNTEFGFYDYGTNNGYPKSAYKNYQQGEFTNCVLKYGCIGTYYPTNTLRSYYNGTWAWSTSGA